MAYLDRDYDVFISYAHDDDGPARWVTHFAQHLEQELQRQLRIKEHFKAVDVTVWKDHRLPQQGNLSERLQSVIEASSIFLVIMSKSYLLSEWCAKEGVMFVNSLKGRSDLRIFIVEIETTDKEQWPEFIQTKAGEPLLSTPFYEAADVGEIDRIPMKTPQGSADPRADRIMKQLCDTLSSQLHSFKHFPTLAVSDHKKTIFLAISPEGKAHNWRTKLITLLKQWNDIVIFPSPEPKTTEAFKDALAKQLPQSDLFVQVLDELQGLYLSDWPTGFVGHQFAVSEEKKRKALHLKVPALDLESLSEGPYKQFLHDLKPQQAGGTVFDGTLEAFARAIRQELDQLASPAGMTVKKGGTCFVAVKADIEDQSIARQVGTEITAAEAKIPITVLYPMPQIRAEELEDLMAFSKGIVMVWGQVELRWALSEYRTLCQVEQQGGKVSAVALCDPYPKPIELGGPIRVMNFWLQADPKQRRSDVAKYVAALQQDMGG